MAQFESLVATALMDGLETTLRELIEALGVTDLGQLQGTLEVLKRIEPFGLVLDPGVDVGDLTTARVMRTSRKPDALLLSERVAELAQRGESNTLEFKSSLIADMKRLAATSELHPLDALEGECLKSVCALLNSTGGTLLIGVDDSGASCNGIECDLKVKNWSEDQWMLHWNGLIKGRFDDGVTVLPFVQSEFATMDSHRVCVVTVLQRQRPAFVRRSKTADLEFFVRLGPQSESLALPAFYEYIRERLERQRASGANPP